MKSTTHSRARSRKRPYRQRKTIYELPPLELECMKALWTLGEGSVRQIREQLAAARRPLAYTTVETIMDRLTSKGAVERRKRGRAHHYTPVYQRQEARAQAVEALVEHFFSGSRRALLAHLEGGPVREPAPVLAGAAVAAPARPRDSGAGPALRLASRPSSARLKRSRHAASEPSEAIESRRSEAPIDTSLL